MNEPILCIIDYRDSDWVFRTVELPIPTSEIQKGFQHAKTFAALTINKQTKYGVEKITTITIKSTKSPLL